MQKHRANTRAGKRQSLGLDPLAPTSGLATLVECSRSNAPGRIAKGPRSAHCRSRRQRQRGVHGPRGRVDDLRSSWRTITSTIGPVVGLRSHRRPHAIARTAVLIAHKQAGGWAGAAVGRQRNRGGRCDVGDRIRRHCDRLRSRRRERSFVAEATTESPAARTRIQSRGRSSARSRRTVPPALPLRTPCFGRRRLAQTSTRVAP